MDNIQQTAVAVQKRSMTIHAGQHSASEDQINTLAHRAV